MELGLSQQELAEKVGYASGKSMIAKIESGLVDLNQTKIKQFASALNMSPGELMGWESDRDAIADATLDARIANDSELKDAIRKYYSLPREKQLLVLNLVNSL